MNNRAILTAVFLAIPLTAIAQAPRYTPVFLAPALPGPINAQGQVIGRMTVAGHDRAVVMRAGSPERLLPLPPGMNSSIGYDLNDAGVVVGQVGPEYTPDFSGRAAAWYPDGSGGWTVVVFGVLPGHIVSLARAVNNPGDIVGWSRDGMFRTPVLFRPDGTLVSLAPTGIFDPMDVNDRRIVVDNSSTARRLDLETMTVQDLGVPDPPGDTNYRATWTAAINEANQVVGSAILATSTSCDRQATRFTDGRGWEIFSPCGPNNIVNDIDDRGDMTMLVGLAPHVRFEDGGVFPIESIIVNDDGHWYVVNSTASWINNPRRIVVFAHNDVTGQSGTLLLVPETPADVVPGGATDRLALAALPNPVRAGTRFRFSLAEAGTVDLAIYDIAGRRVATLLSAARREAGPGDVAWDGRDARGAPVPGGVYVARLEAAGTTVRRQLVVLR